MTDEGGGPLVVSGGGSTAVTTDDLGGLGSALRELAARCGDWADGLAGVAWISTDARLDGLVAGARARATRLGDGARELADDLDRAAEAYGTVDRMNSRLQEQLGGVLGWFAGFLGLAVLPALLWTGVGLTVDVVLAWFAAQGLRRLQGLPVDDPGEWLQQHSGVINSTAMAALVRALVSSVDDAAEGALGVPLPVARGLGDSGLRVLGVDSSAIGALALGGLFGFLRETPVTSRQVDAAGASVSVPAHRGARTGAVVGAPVFRPSGVAELLARVPPPDVDGPQVRVERYPTGPTAGAGSASGVDTAGPPGRNDRWVVYIGGTVSWEAGGSTQPWDLTSNVQGVAGDGACAGSYRAVIDAMEQAGVRDGDQVLAVGHSQGGLLAARLANDERYTATGLVTAGAPIAQVPLPPEVPVLQIEHSDDLVPALGGYAQPDPSPDHLVVRREYLAARDEPVAGWVPTHELRGYRETAELIDGLDDPRITRLRSEIVDASASAAEGPPGARDEGTATWWLGRRG